MYDIITALGDALRTLATWELNGLLALLYTAWEHLAALVTAGAFAGLLWWTPPGRRSPTLAVKRSRANDRGYWGSASWRCSRLCSRRLPRRCCWP